MRGIINGGLCILTCFILLSITFIPSIQSEEITKEINSIIEGKLHFLKHFFNDIMLNLLQILLKISIKLFIFEFLIFYISGFIFGIRLFNSLSCEYSSHFASLMGIKMGFICAFTFSSKTISIFLQNVTHFSYGIMMKILSSLLSMIFLIFHFIELYIIINKNQSSSLF
jgi:hypothetical protein